MTDPVVMTNVTTLNAVTDALNHQETQVQTTNPNMSKQAQQDALVAALRQQREAALDAVAALIAERTLLTDKVKTVLQENNRLLDLLKAVKQEYEELRKLAQ